MIVQRNTFNVKPGQVEKAVELLKEAIGMKPVTHGVRIYTSNIGPFNKLVAEAEFENLAEHEDYWEQWWSLPETPAFFEKWNEVVTGGDSKIWDLVD